MVLFLCGTKLYCYKKFVKYIELSKRDHETTEWMAYHIFNQLIMFKNIVSHGFF